MSDNQEEATQDEATTAASPASILPKLRNLAMRPETATTALVDDVATLSNNLSHANDAERATVLGAVDAALEALLNLPTATKDDPDDRLAEELNEALFAHVSGPNVSVHAPSSLRAILAALLKPKRFHVELRMRFAHVFEALHHARGGHDLVATTLADDLVALAAEIERHLLGAHQFYLQAGLMKLLLDYHPSIPECRKALEVLERRYGKTLLPAVAAPDSVSSSGSVSDTLRAFLAAFNRHHPETTVCVVEPLRLVVMGHEFSPEADKCVLFCRNDVHFAGCKSGERYDVRLDTNDLEQVAIRDDATRGTWVHLTLSVDRVNQFESQEDIDAQHSQPRTVSLLIADQPAADGEESPYDQLQQRVLSKLPLALFPKHDGLGAAAAGEESAEVSAPHYEASGSVGFEAALERHEIVASVARSLEQELVAVSATSMQQVEEVFKAPSEPASHVPISAMPMLQVHTEAAPRVVSQTAMTLASRTLPLATTDIARPEEASPPVPTVEAPRVEVEVHAPRARSPGQPPPHEQPPSPGQRVRPRQPPAGQPPQSRSSKPSHVSPAARRVTRLSIKRARDGGSPKESSLGDDLTEPEGHATLRLPTPGPKPPAKPPTPLMQQPTADGAADEDGFVSHGDRRRSSCKTGAQQRGDLRVSFEDQEQVEPEPASAEALKRMTNNELRELLVQDGSRSFSSVSKLPKDSLVRLLMETRAQQRLDAVHLRAASPSAAQSRRATTVAMPSRPSPRRLSPLLPAPASPLDESFEIEEEPQSELVPRRLFRSRASSAPEWRPAQLEKESEGSEGLSSPEELKLADEGQAVAEPRELSDQELELEEPEPTSAQKHQAFLRDLRRIDVEVREQDRADLKRLRDALARIDKAEREAQVRVISSIVDACARDISAIGERAIADVNATVARLPTPRGRADELAREFVHMREEVNNALVAMGESDERNLAADAVVAELHTTQATHESKVAAALDTLRTKLEHARTTRDRSLSKLEASRRKSQRKMNAAIREFCLSGV